MSNSRKAIIIGGGIGGLAAGIALKRNGFEVEIFERAREVGEVGAGLTLWANALKALDWLGIGQMIRPVHVPDFKIALRSSDGTIISEAMQNFLLRKFGEPCIVIRRPDLFAALLKNFGDKNVHIGTSFVGFHQNAEGVTAQFSYGRSARGNILIGADGLNSTVREQMHGIQKPVYAGYTAWRAVARFDHQLCRMGESWGMGARFGQLPMSDGFVYWYATKNINESNESPDGEKNELLRTFSGWHSPIEKIIEATDESLIARNDIYDRPLLRTWGYGRVTLLGDAAHPMTPDLGQGACQALEDAVVLSQCMQNENSIEAALRSYERRRIRRTGFIVRLSHQTGSIGQWQHPGAVLLRNFFLKNGGSYLQAHKQKKIIGYEV